MAHIEIDDEVDDSVEVSDDEIVEESSGSYVLHHGEALAWLRSLSDGYADALVTDPPAGIAFMNKGWDHDKGGRTAWVAWLAEILREALRALKPGAAGFVWALPRTSHWTATACEDAGFEVRDVVTHVQGQGFPKSKALLKPAAENWIHVRSPLDIEHWIAIINSSICDLEELWKTVLLEQTDMHLSKETASICLNIVQSWKITLVVLWNAMNTSITKMDNELIIVLRTLNYLLSKITPENMLKDLISADGQKSHVKLVNAYFDALRTSYQNTQTPSAHDIVTAQAVFKKTLAAVSPLAVAEQKTAPGSEHWILVRAPGPLRPLRIDDCRVGTSKRVPGSVCKTDSKIYGKGFSLTTGDTPGSDPNVGRWPANFAMSHSEGCKVQMRHTQPMVDVDGKCIPHPGYPDGVQVEDWACEADCPVRLLGEQSGVRGAHGRGAAQGQPPRRTRGVTYGVPSNPRPYPMDRSDTGTAARFFPCFYQPKASKRDRGEGNNHPTVKSVALMRWLVRLVCPVGGLVLDPFTGSGSTGVAALAEGLRFAGCEREAEYVQIARARLDKALP
jgi:DNA modification methylase